MRTSAEKVRNEKVRVTIKLSGIGGAKRATRTCNLTGPDARYKHVATQNPREFDAEFGIWSGETHHSNRAERQLAVTRAALKIDPSIAEHSIIVASIPVLMRMLERGSFRQQREAAEALGAIGPPARAALPLLRERAKPLRAETEAERLSRYSVRRAAKKAIAAIER